MKRTQIKSTCTKKRAIWSSNQKTKSRSSLYTCKCKIQKNICVMCVEKEFDFGRACILYIGMGKYNYRERERESERVYGGGEVKLPGREREREMHRGGKGKSEKNEMRRRGKRAANKAITWFLGAEDYGGIFLMPRVSIHTMGVMVILLICLFPISLVYPLHPHFFLISINNEVLLYSCVVQSKIWISYFFAK